MRRGWTEPRWHLTGAGLVLCIVLRVVFVWMPAAEDRELGAFGAAVASSSEEGRALPVPEAEQCASATEG